MKITQLITPISEVRWLLATDTVRDAFDHMESYDVLAAPLLDWRGRYLGTVTEADLRRHVSGSADAQVAMNTPLGHVERRARNVAVRADRDVASVVDHGSPFVPVVDDTDRLIGVVDRRTLRSQPLPRAA